MKGIHKKSSNEIKNEIIADKENNTDELTNSTFDPFIRSNIEINQTKMNNPMKIQCPLKNRVILNWNLLIDDYFDSLSLCDHPKFSQAFYQRMLSLSDIPNKQDIIEYITEKINTLTDQSCNELLSQKNLTSFYEKIDKIQMNIQTLDIIFNHLCGNITNIVISSIKEHFSSENIRRFRDMIQSIVNDFSEDKNFEIISLIIRFFTQFDILTKEIKDHFSSTFINTISSIVKKSKETPFESTAKLYCKLCQIFPLGETSILERIIKPYLKNVVKMSLKSFITELSSNITDYFEDIYNFVYSTNESDLLINYFIDYYGSYSKKLNFDEIVDNFRIFRNFSPEVKIKIAQSMRKCFTKNDESIAIRYADLIDQSFRNDIQNNDFKDSKYDMLDEMHLIQNRDVFESAHLAHMLRRSLEMSMVPDQNFTEKYKLLFGDCSVAGFESVLNDYKESTQLTDEFKLTNEIPPFLNIYAFYSCNWSRKYRKLSIMPEVLRSYLENFSKFYKEKMPRRFIEWSPLLSNCILVINGITIKCNGLIASILYSLQDGPKTSDEISREIFSDIEEVEVILNTLKTNNYGNFITLSNDQYSINSKAKPEDDLIDIPLYTPKDSKYEERREKVAIMTSRGRQIEAVILLCLKKESTIKESELFTLTQQKLKFILDDFLFEEKLKTLAMKHFIKRDTDDNTVTFIP